MQRLTRLKPTAVICPWAVVVLLSGQGCATAKPSYTSSYGTLKQAASASGRLVGSEVEAELLRSDAAYAAVVKREFNVIVPQNEMKFGWVNKDRSWYDFSDADTIVKFAQKNGMKVRGTTLAWHRNYPDWLKEGSFTGDELREILLNHIRVEVTHFRSNFPGRVFAWDVVNEAFDKDGKLRDEMIWSRIGNSSGDYIPLAFKTAKDADPGAEMFYNDFNTEELNQKSDAVYALLLSLKSAGVPVDGVGFQMHLDYREKLDMDSVRKNMERFTKLGLKIQITEFDYLLPESPSESLLEREAKAYHDFAALCVSIPACEAFVSWGFTDAHSWIPEFFSGYGSALYFDEQYGPKRAYAGLLSGLGPER